MQQNTGNTEKIATEESESTDTTTDDTESDSPTATDTELQELPEVPEGE